MHQARPNLQSYIKSVIELLAFFFFFGFSLFTFKSKCQYFINYKNTSKYNKFDNKYIDLNNTIKNKNLGYLPPRPPNFL